MAKRYSKTTKKTTRYKVDPKDTKILEQFTKDSRGNEFRFIFDVKPHLPSEPTIKGTVKYNEKEKR